MCVETLLFAHQLIKGVLIEGDYNASMCHAKHKSIQDLFEGSHGIGDMC